MNFFSLVYKYLLGLLGVHPFNFPWREYFFCTSSPPPLPHDPFLLLYYLYLDQHRPSFVAWLQDRDVIILVTFHPRMMFPKLCV